MFRDVNLAAPKVTILDSMYIKITYAYRNISGGSLRTLQIPEQLVCPRKCLSAMKNRTILTTLGMRHWAQVKKVSGYSEESTHTHHNWSMTFN